MQPGSEPSPVRKIELPSHLKAAVKRPPVQAPAQTGLGSRFLNPADFKRLGNFQFATKLVVEGFYHGKHRSPFHDFSSEFADYRPYTPGDEIRAIDWRAFARTDRFYIKLFRKETDMNCIVVLDQSRSMGFAGEGGDLTKLEYGSYLAAALYYLMIRQGDKAGIALCDEKLRTYIPPGGTNMALKRTLVALEGARPSGQTNLGESLKTLFGIVKRKGLLVVVSDFLDDPESVFSALSMFAHKGFSVLLFHTLSDDELDLPKTQNALFQDPESSFSIAAEPDSIRQAYQEEVQGFIQDIGNRAKARRMYYHLARTSQPYHAALEAFLTTKARQ